MKRTALSFGIVAAAAFTAAPAAAETRCTVQTELVGVVGSAITGGSSQLIWVVQQCVDSDTGAVRASAQLCEMEDDVDTNVPAKCSAPAPIGDAVSK